MCLRTIWENERKCERDGWLWSEICLHYTHNRLLAGEWLPSQGLNCPTLFESKYCPLASLGTPWFSPVEWEWKLWGVFLLQTYTKLTPCSQGYGFSCGHVWMWELDCEEGWAPQNWCFWTVVLEKTLQSPLDCKEIQPIHPEGDQSWVFFRRTDAVLLNSNTLAT